MSYAITRKAIKAGLFEPTEAVKFLLERLEEVEARLALVEKLAVDLTHINGIGLAAASHEHPQTKLKEAKE